MTDPLSIEYRPLAALVPYARNARTHSVEQVAQIAASIEAFGFNNPILIDDEGGIVAGHGRALAAAKLGLTDVPCVKLGHLSKAQRRAYVIADNKLALNADWDLAALTLELGELQTEIDLEVIGFNSDELKELLAPKEAAEGAKELSEGDFQEFDKKCPRCGFEFDETSPA